VLKFCSVGSLGHSRPEVAESLAEMANRNRWYTGMTVHSSSGMPTSSSLASVLTCFQVGNPRFIWIAASS
jgi:hypothetical protein